jgi:hypothetical protein
MRLVSQSDLKTAQTILRRDDPAIRLRFAAETPDVLIERKTFRGRVGSKAPDGLDWPVDSGRRREEGHVLVATLPRQAFDVREVRQALQERDTWRKYELRSRPRHLEIEEAESRAKAHRKLSRHQDNWAFSAERYDHFVWGAKSRVSVL